MKGVKFEIGIHNPLNYIYYRKSSYCQIFPVHEPKGNRQVYWTCLNDDARLAWSCSRFTEREA